MPKNIDFKDPFAAIEIIGRQVGIWQWDRDQDISHWSGYLVALLGYNQEDNGKSFLAFEELVHPEDRPQLEQALRDHIDRGTPYRAKVRMRHKAGHYLDLITQGILTRRTSTSNGVMIGTVVDISAEVRARATADEQAGILSSLAKNIPGAILRYKRHQDGRGDLEFLNQGTLNISEFSAKEIKEDASKFWKLALPEDVEELMNSMEESAKNLAPWGHEWRILTPSNQEKFLQVRGLPTAGTDGSIIWDCVILDVTSERQIRLKLEEREREVFQLQKAEALDQLSSGIAHDFNNLLAIIMGNAEYLRRTQENESEQEISAEIIEACQRGSELTKHMLAFTRESAFEVREVDLAAIVENLNTMLVRVMPSNIRIRLEIPDDIWLVITDSSLLETALVNLCSNARDAMPDGGTLTITARNVDASEDRACTEEDILAKAHVEICVRDTGIGISARDLNRVTDPFFTTKGAAKGPGLGLAVVHGMIERSDGTLKVQSTEDLGTTIELRIPAISGKQTHTRLELAEMTRHSNRARYNIVIVEDEIGVLRSMRRHLEKEGHTVQVFERGEEFAQFLVRETTVPDLVLVDFVLPGELQGWNIVQLVRKKLPGAKIVLMSGYSVDEVQEHGGATEGEMLLQKPISHDALIQAIETVMAAER